MKKARSMKSTGDEVAVIGMSGRFPGADTVSAFWDKLCARHESIRRLPDEELRRAGVPERDLADPAYVKVGATLDGVALFDPAFFRISPLEAELMDPQLRLLLECAWELLEDAGHARREAQNIGVFTGAGGVTTNYFSHFVNVDDRFERVTASPTHLGNDKDFLSTYLSYKLNLTGPSMTVQTACSTSLVALHQARLSLLAGECDMAIAGGVSIRVPHEQGYHYREGYIFSRSGRVMSFDERADGVVFGSGAGLVLIKRLSDALRDRDNIYAVIKGSAIGNDGRGKMSYAASSAKGQIACVLSALKSAGIDAGSIGFVESHGTGTAMGDPEEVKALSAAFREHTDKTGYCSLGAVKANVGHLEAAAGIVGFIKAVLAVKHGLIPPMLHFEKANPRIKFENTPFRIDTAPRVWQPEQGPRRAAVNSLGVGGTNAFVILEAAPAVARPARRPAGEPCIVPLSARSAESLRGAVQRLAGFLGDAGSSADRAIDLRDLAYTLQCGREAMEHRVAFVASDCDQLRQALARYLESGCPGTVEGKAGELAAAWAGGADVAWPGLQGDDAPCRISLPTYAFARERCWIDAAPRREGRHALHPLLHTNTSDLAEQKYSAMLDGEEFFLRDHLVRARTREGAPGAAQRVLPAVAYIEMARCAVEQAAPSHRDTAVLEFRDLTWLQPIAVDEPTEVSIALQAGTAPGCATQHVEFEVFTLDDSIHCQGRCHFVDAEPPARIDTQGLRERIGGEGRAADQIYADFSHMGLEYGVAHRPILGLWRSDRELLAELALPDAVQRDRETYVLHPSLMDGALQAATCLVFAGGNPPARPIVPFAMQALRIVAPCSGRMWAWARHGARWQPGDRSAQLDIELLNDRGEVCIQMRGFVPRMLGRETHGSLLATRVWVPSPAAPAQAVSAEQHVLLFGLPGVEPHRVARDCRTIEVDRSLDMGEHYTALALHVFEKLQSLLNSHLAGRTVLQLVVPLSPDTLVFAGLAGLLKSARIENPLLAGQIVMVDAEIGTAALAALLHAERAHGHDTLVRYEGGVRHTAGWQLLGDEQAHAFVDQAPFKAHGVYVITGGLGGLGLLFAREILARAPDARIVLTGRAPEDELACDPDRSAALAGLQAAAPGVEYCPLDLASPEQTAATLAAIVERHGQLNGIIHSAGRVADAFILKKGATEFRAVLAPKVDGTLNLDRATRHIDLDFLVLFSSLSAAVGNLGQADYAAANGFLDEFAAWRNRQVQAGLRRGRTLAIRWPLWRDGGMQPDRAGVEMLHSTTGISPMPTAVGLRMFYRSLALEHDQTLVMDGDLALMQRALGIGAALHAAGAPAVSPEPAPGAAGDLGARAEDWLCRQLSSLLKLPPHKRVDAGAALEEYGIDSIMALELTRMLEKTFGELPKTLFFEYLTIRELAAYFVRAHAAALAGLWHADAGAPDPAGAPAPRADAAAEKPDGAVASIRLRKGRGAGAALPSCDPGVSAAVPIAIVGLSGRYPESPDIEAFWRNLRDGRDCVIEVPRERWDWRDYYSEDRSAPGAHYSRWGGFIEGVDEFDARFFNISPLEAESIDPQERLFLQHAWMAVEDAGYTRPALQQARSGDMPAQVGVYAGVMYSEYQLFGAEASLLGQRTGFASNPASIANRVSYFLNLHGPSMTVDTMCSSSLTAIHLACQDLRLGRIALGIAGGVNVSIHPNKYLMLSAGQFISSDGHCQSFGEGGDGYIPGEGVGVVVLKRLPDAERDGDRIHGVIRGSALSHGGKTNGFTVPNPAAQAGAIRQALADAGVDARHVSYLEAHGTGTRLGDPIEIAGLCRAFGDHTADTGFCLIGSAKSNIGHAEAAAGIAGLTKVLLQMRYRQIVPSLHSQRLNPHIDFARTPFVVNQTLTPWRAPVLAGRQLPRIAGISSFGAGGSNAHLIVEEYAQPAAATPADALHVVPLSARTAEQLRDKVRDLLGFIDRQGEALTLASLAYTLQVGREPLQERLAVLADALPVLAARLKGWLDGAGTALVWSAQAKGDHSALGAPANLPEASGVPGGQGAGAEARLARIAEDWTRGVAPDWQALHAVRPPLVSLPPYPFARQRHWTAAARARRTGRHTLDALHPLLHRNLSDFGQQRYTATFAGDEFFLEGEAGARTFSAPACLEMARAAFEAAMPAAEGLAALEVRQVAWASSPVLAADLTLGIALFARTGDQASFEIFSHAEGVETIHCQGHVRRIAAGGAAPDAAPADDALTGLQVPAALRAEQARFGLHPALLAQAFSLAAARLGRAGHARPVTLDALQFLHAPGETCRARVLLPAQDAVDVELYATDGRLCAVLRGLRHAPRVSGPCRPDAAAQPPAPAALAQEAPAMPRQVPITLPPVQVSAPAGLSAGRVVLRAPAAGHDIPVRPAHPVKPRLRLDAPGQAGIPTAARRAKPAGVALAVPGAAALRSGPILPKPRLGLAAEMVGDLPAPAALTLLDHGNGLFSIRFNAAGPVLTPGLVEQLLGALDRARQAPTLKVLRLDGGEAAFLRGGADAHRSALEAGLYRAIAAFPCPVMAVLRGGADGAGMLLAALCDFMFCSDRGEYAFARPGEGLLPSMAEDLFTQRLGPAAAAAFLYGLPQCRGAQLRDLGWTCPVLPETEIDAAAARLAAELVQMPQPALHLLKARLAQPLCATVDALPMGPAGSPPVAAGDTFAQEADWPVASGCVALARHQHVLEVRLTAEAAQAGADWVEDLRQVLAQASAAPDIRCVLLGSALDTQFPGGMPSRGVAQACRDLLLACERPLVMAVRERASPLACYLAQCCEFAVFAADGQYSLTDVLSDPVLESDLAAALAYRTDEEGGKAWWPGDSLSGTALREQGGVLHVAAAGDVDGYARRIAGAVAAWPADETRQWKARNRDAINARIAGTAPVEPAVPPTPLPAAGTAAPVSLASQAVSARLHADGVLEVHMQAREARNMFSPALTEGMREVFAYVAAHEQCKVVVLTGYDTFFSLGGTPEILLAIHAGQARFTDNPTFHLPLDCAVPVVAAMQGHALGAGWAMGMFADFSILGEECRYCSPYMGYGFTPGAGATLVFPLRTGHDLSRETLLSAREYTGGELKARGLPHAVLPREAVLDAALALAHGLARNGRARLAALKARWAQRLRAALADTFEHELAMHARTYVGQDEALARIQDRLQTGAPRHAARAPEPLAPPAQGHGDLRGITAHLRGLLAHELRMAEHEIGEDEQFVDLGLDSITGVTWMRRVNEAYGTDIEAIQVYSHPTLASLARFVQAQAATVPATRAPSVAATSRSSGTAAAAGDTLATDTVVGTLRALLAHELRMAEGEIGEDEQFVDLGLDSITGVTWIRRVNERYGTDIEAIRVYSYPTLRLLAGFVISQVRPAEGSAAPVEVTPPAPVAAELASPRPATAGAGHAADGSADVVLRSWRRAGSGAGASGASPIAVIGMAGRFARSPDLERFWQNIAAGRDCIDEIPPQRWDIEACYQPGEAAPGKTYSRWMGLLDDHDRFDAAFFSISPREARSMDPQQRVFLEACWHGIEHAGYNPKALGGSRCGVFVGCSTGDYHQLSRREQLSGQGFTGAAPSILAARISYLLDLQGPSVAIDTACSSSLVAIASACDSLASGGSDLALAGGVNVMAGPAMQIMTAQLGMLSPQGRCFTFDDRANGIVNGEGVGVVMLKRLADAERDGDCIYGVIEGWGVNQDGRTNGITAPNADSQARLQQRVHERFGIDPATIQLIEAHGTGTALGDPIEVAGLKAAFAARTTRQGYCALGSVKSNIGHCLTAAGVSGVLKVLLAFKHRQLPPTLHFGTLNRHIVLKGSPFFVNDRLRDWPDEGGVRRAAVNAFGFSGTNAHLVMAAYPDTARAVSPAGPAIVPLSARTAPQLQQLARAMSGFLAGPDGGAADLHALAWTLQTGREPMPERVAFVARDIDDLRRQLDAFASGSPAPVAHWRGQAGDAAGALAAFADDPDFLSTIAKWIARRALPRLAELWTRGLALDWTGLYAGRPPRRVGLPGYPFARDRHWIDAEAEQPAVAPTRHAVKVYGACDGELFATVRRETDGADIELFNARGELCLQLTGLDLAEIGPALAEPRGADQPEPAVASAARAGTAGSFAASAEAPGLARLQDELAQSLAEALFMDAADIDPHRTFTELGLDSIIGVEWVKTLNARYGTALSATRVYDYPSVGELAAYLQAQLAAGGPVAGTPPGRSAQPAAVAGPRRGVDTLQRQLAASLAEALFMNPEDVDIDRSFTELGLDSIVGVEWVKVLNAEYGIGMAATRIYDTPSIRELAAWIDDTRAAAARGHEAGYPEAPPAAPPQPAVPGHDALPGADLQRALRASLAEALFMAPEDIDPGRSFTELGLDSIIGVEWIKRINAEYRLELGATRIYDYPSIRELAAYLQGVLAEQGTLPLKTADTCSAGAAEAPPALSAPTRSPAAGLRLQPAGAALKAFRFAATDPARLASLHFQPLAVTGNWQRGEEVSVRFALDPDHNVSLREHVVFGQHLLPTDAFIELVHVAFSSCFESAAPSFERIVIVSPLIGVPGRPTEVSVSFRAGADSLQFFVRSAADRGQHRLHMQGVIASAAPHAGAAAEEAFACERTLGAGEIATNTGRHYAPLQSLAFGPDRAQAEIRVTDAPYRFLVNPLVLYGGLCTVINHAAHRTASLEGACHDHFLPYRIGRITVHAPLDQPAYRCQARMLSAGRDQASYSFEILAPDGQYVAAVESIELRRVAKETLVRAAAVRAPSPASVPGAPQDARAGEGIAIVGMSCRFPMSPDTERFWENLAAGRHCVTEVPAGRWPDPAAWYHPDPRHPHTSYSKWGGFLDDIDAFDPLFFGISPAEAELIDPQQRIFLQECWKAVESAGYAPGALSGSACGVYVGCSTGDYVRVLRDAGQDSAGAAFMGTSNAILAARIAYYLNLKGPALAVDTACSSSLVAIHLACESLRNGENTLALAGGINLLTTPIGHVLTSQVGMPSPDGRCAAFDASANGIVFSEGCGVLLLKPLSAAERDGDEVLGVIRASGINQDGKTNGITAPSSRAQEQLLRQVYARFGIDPRQIGMIEAHGTATALGDPIEVNALSAVFGPGDSGQPHCALGSVKSNIGHAGFAAGVASVIKVLLCMRHRMLVPSLHYRQPNPHIDFARSPFQVTTACTDWVSEGPRLAAVSSFGFSGTNAHLVVEEWPDRHVSHGAVPQPGGDVLVPLSARSAEQLRQQVADLLAHLGRHADRIDLARVAYTLQVGRDPMDHRLAVVAGSVAALADRLQRVLDARGEVDGVFRGRVSRGDHLLAGFADDPDMRALVARWVAQKNLRKLGELWARGLDLDWHAMYAPGHPRRLALPTYPFAQERCWVQDTGPARAAAMAPAGQVVLHPLLHANMSDLAQQRYRSHFGGHEFFLADHRIQGQAVLPAVAYIEMAYAAMRHALPEQARTQALRMRDLVWAEPIVVAAPTRVAIAVFAEEPDSFGFEVFSEPDEGGDERLHCQGSCVPLPDAASVTLDLAALRQVMPRDGGAIQRLYEGFAARGLGYGPAFRALVALRHGDGQVLAELALPPAAGMSSGGTAPFTLHPSLMDGALQASIPLIDEAAGAAGVTVVPFAVESVQVFDACDPHMFAWVRHTPGSQGAWPHLVRVDIDLCDARGRVRVQMRGFSSRPVERDPGFDEARYQSIIAGVLNRDISADDAVELG